MSGHGMTTCDQSPSVGILLFLNTTFKQNTAEQSICDCRKHSNQKLTILRDSCIICGAVHVSALFLTVAFLNAIYHPPPPPLPIYGFLLK